MESSLNKLLVNIVFILSNQMIFNLKNFEKMSICVFYEILRQFVTLRQVWIDFFLLFYTTLSFGIIL